MQRSQVAHRFIEPLSLNQLLSFHQAHVAAIATKIGALLFQDLVQQAAGLAIVRVMLEDGFQGGRGKMPIAFVESRAGAVERLLASVHFLGRTLEGDQFRIESEFSPAARHNFTGLIRLAGVEIALRLGKQRTQCAAALLLRPQAVEKRMESDFAGAGSFQTR